MPAVTTKRLIATKPLSKNASLLIAIVALSFCGCQSHPNTIPVKKLECDHTPINTLASKSSKALLQQLALLSCNQIPGVISGQNAGHGLQLIDKNSSMSYQHNVERLSIKTGQTPYVLGIDYEHDRIFTAEELIQTNSKLIEHAKAGGIVTINWSPHSPWANDESDIANNPGTHQHSRSQHTPKPDLKALIQQGSAINKIWLKKLDRIAEALNHLQQNDVPVLWRPLQEMNGFWFWWGHTEPMSDASEYVAVWQHMYHYLTEVKGLNNLLWVYSPNDTVRLNAGLITRKPMWAYPGDNYVDVIAGTNYEATLKLKYYDDIKGLSKPLGIAEYGPDFSSKGLDNRLYAQRLLQQGKRIAYWVSWHSYPDGQGGTVDLSLIDNNYAKELLNNPQVYTLEKPVPNDR